MLNLKDKFVAGFSFIVGLLVVLAIGIPLRAQTVVRYGIAETKDVMVAMRDGVKLAADIYRPTQNSRQRPLHQSDSSPQCYVRLPCLCAPAQLRSNLLPITNLG